MKRMLTALLGSLPTLGCLAVAGLGMLRGLPGWGWFLSVGFVFGLWHTAWCVAAGYALYRQEQEREAAASRSGVSRAD